jgi:hypothetical protein
MARQRRSWMNIKRFGAKLRYSSYMTLKVVPIKDKMARPTLQETVERLNSMFKGYEQRGEDKLTVVLSTLSYCIWNLQKITEDDQTTLSLIDEILNQYMEVDRHESVFNNYVLFEALTPKTSKDDD